MKATNNPHRPVPFGEPVYDTMTFASYRRIIEAMRKAGELALHPGEYVANVIVEEHGITFHIERE